jgi:lysosomal acid lipase/cholesteryl ester hydrolase
MANLGLILLIAVTHTAIIRAMPVASPAEYFGFKHDWNDPEIGATAMDVIKRWDYPVELYNVTTEDGYILKLLRIPHGRQNNETKNPRPVVYMQHGLESSCMDWIINLPTESAAYIYADQGFDVWMGNFRGNYYSTEHIKYTLKDREYWRFSWDEMAHYDLPALIHKTLEVTGAKQVYYMGHSMGTTTIMAKLAHDPGFGKYIKKIYALAPVGTVNHLKGASWLLSLAAKLIEDVTDFFHIDDMFPTTQLQDTIARYICGTTILDKLCINPLLALTGPESKQLNETRMPVYMSHTPAGTSTRTIVHYAQEHSAKKFQMYDFGKENQKLYNQTTPPIYNVTKIETPIALYWGGKDYLADPQDVKDLISKLPSLAGAYEFPIYNHMDFIWGLRVADEIYRPILKEISNDFGWQV